MKTILLVEDDSSVRALLRATLEDPTYRILEAHSGEEALRIARSESVDLAVLDWMLPGISGLDVLHAFTKSRPLFPAIILTGRTRDQDMKLAFSHSARHYLKKPFNPVEVSRRVEALLS